MQENQDGLSERWLPLEWILGNKHFQDTVHPAWFRLPFYDFVLEVIMFTLNLKHSRWLTQKWTSVLQMRLIWRDFESDFKEAYWNSLQLLQKTRGEEKMEKKGRERDRYNGREEFKLFSLILYITIYLMALCPAKRMKASSPVQLNLTRILPAYFKRIIWKTQYIILLC